MTDMTRTLKLINDCDEEILFERQVKRELLRLVSTIERLEAQLYAVGAGGVSGPVMVEPEKPVTLHLTMCADQHCGNYATCYRAQAEVGYRQAFFAVSPRDGDFCTHYAPMQWSDGTSAMKESNNE